MKTARPQPPAIPIEHRVLLSVAEAAALCGWTENTLRSRLKAHPLAMLRLSPQDQPRISRAALDAWIAALQADCEERAATPGRGIRNLREAVKRAQGQ